jgi:hypothetical protein
MYTECLLLVALIFSAFPSSAQERRAAPTRGVAIVERLRSEFLSVLDTEAAARKDVSLPSRRLDPDRTPEGDAPVVLGPRLTFRRGSACWWLWVLFGNELCPAGADRTTVAWSSPRGGVSQMSLMRADG